jgi:hypothetical protein
VAKRGALERAHIRDELVRLLAAGEIPRAKLAKRFGVAGSSVTEFAQRHVADIDRVRDKLTDEFAGLWIAEKRARLVHLQDQVDRVLDLVEDPGEAARANVGMAEIERVVQTALRNAAEELGQLPSRHTVQHEGGVSVRYELVGIALEDLS